MKKYKQHFLVGVLLCTLSLVTPQNYMLPYRILVLSTEFQAIPVHPSHSTVSHVTSQDPLSPYSILGHSSEFKVNLLDTMSIYSIQSHHTALKVTQMDLR
jgi:hypothetical protein